MADWRPLETDLTTWLGSFATSGLHYRNPYQAIVGYPSSGFRSDGMLTDGTKLLAIEVEAGQIHPDTNVGKYWLLWEQYKAYEHITLIHIFTPDYYSYGWRMGLANFYAEQMKASVPFDYLLLDLREAAENEEVLANTKKLIEEKVQELFD